jgi:adenine deaminase
LFIIEYLLRRIWIMIKHIVLFLAFWFCMVAGEARQQKNPKRKNCILIQQVNIFNGPGDNLAEGQDILIKGNLIEAIGQNITAPAGATVIDGNGRTLTPGFIDAHTHLQWNSGHP